MARLHIWVSPCAAFPERVDLDECRVTHEGDERRGLLREQGGCGDHRHPQGGQDAQRAVLEVCASSRSGSWSQPSTHVGSKEQESRDDEEDGDADIQSGQEAVERRVQRRAAVEPDVGREDEERAEGTDAVQPREGVRTSHAVVEACCSCAHWRRAPEVADPSVGGVHGPACTPVTQTVLEPVAASIRKARAESVMTSCRRWRPRSRTRSSDLLSVCDRSTAAALVK